MSHRVIGIDPGLKGGIVTMDNGEIIATLKMPIHKFEGSSAINWHHLAGYLEGQSPYMVSIEKVNAMPGQGVCSMFSFGTNYGGLLGLCAGLGIPFTLVRPQQWQKEIFSGIDKRLGKARSKVYCQQRWPHIEPLQKNDGLADAACIALWLSKEINR
jgi:crossover junction endodeoxyribonuclease RuvC